MSTEETMQCDPNLTHRAVMTYRAISGLTPNRPQRAEIAAAVSDIVRWREVVEKWLLAGYRPNNVAGMLDWYNKGIPERRSESGRHGAAGRSGLQAVKANEQKRWERVEDAGEAARLAAEWEALSRESR